MTPLNFDFDRLSDNDLTRLVQAACRQYLSRPNLVPMLEIPGDGEQPLGFLLPTPVDCDPPSEEFWAEARRRIADPNTKLLTVDEFLDALDDYWSKADAAGR